VTFSQKIIYECIKKYMKEKHLPPSIRDICEMAGLSSPATVHKHLKNMKNKGYIDYEPKKKRSIRIC
jgi:repressor LexA